MNLLVLLICDMLLVASGAFAMLAFLLWTEPGDRWLAHLQDEHHVRIEVGNDFITVHNTVSADQAQWIANAMKSAWKDKP